MTTAEVRHLFAYTEWANARVLEAAEKLPPEELLRDVHISYKSILGTLLHMAGAEWMWLERWYGHSPVGPMSGRDGRPATLAACSRCERSGSQSSKDAMRIWMESRMRILRASWVTGDSPASPIHCRSFSRFSTS